MDTLNHYHHIISEILKEYASLPYAYGDLKRKLIIGEDHKSYVLFTLGYLNERRVHGCVVHIEIIDDKIWIHEDGLEDGIASDSVRAGIPKNKIVLGFHPPEIRPHTEFAVN